MNRPWDRRIAKAFAPDQQRFTVLGTSFGSDAYIPRRLELKREEYDRLLLTHVPTGEDVQAAWLLLPNFASLPANYPLRPLLPAAAAYAGQHDDAIPRCLATLLGLADARRACSHCAPCPALGALTCMQPLVIVMLRIGHLGSTRLQSFSGESLALLTGCLMQSGHLLLAASLRSLVPWKRPPTYTVKASTCRHGAKPSLARLTSALVGMNRPTTCVGGNAPPPMPSRNKTQPELETGLTRLASTANWAPCQRGRPLHAT